MLGLGLALAIVQALAAGPISLPKNEEELKARVSSSLLRHGPVGGIVLGALVVGVMLLSQAQNIESAKRLLGLDRKLPEPPPAPNETNNPTVQVIHHHPKPDLDPKILLITHKPPRP